MKTPNDTDTLRAPDLRSGALDFVELEGELDKILVGAAAILSVVVAQELMYVSAMFLT